jgi:hypothetical protein
VLWLGGPTSDPEIQQNAAAFRDTIRAHGWNEGHNLRIDVRWYGSSFTAAPAAPTR